MARDERKRGASRGSSDAAGAGGPAPEARAGGAARGGYGGGFGGPVYRSIREVDVSVAATAPATLDGLSGATVVSLPKGVAGHRGGTGPAYVGVDVKALFAAPPTSARVGHAAGAAQQQGAPGAAGATRGHGGVQYAQAHGGQSVGAQAGTGAGRAAAWQRRSRRAVCGGSWHVRDTFSLSRAQGTYRRDSRRRTC
jgi:hypothetical protein